MGLLKNIHIVSMKMTDIQIEKLDDELQGEIGILQQDCEDYARQLLEASENCKDETRAEFLRQKGKSAEYLSTLVDEVYLRLSAIYYF